MKWFLGIFFGLLLLLTLAVLNLPASIVPQLLLQAEQQQLLAADAPRLTLGDTSGTLWDGRAQDAVLTINGQPLPLGELRWQWQVTKLLSRQLLLDLQTQAPQQTLKATLTAVESGEVKISAAEGRFPISTLKPWFPLLVSGDVAFVVDHVVFNQQRLLAVDAVVKLEYVDWLMGDYDMPLGSYMAQIYLEQQDVQVKINDFGASLGVDGLLTINPAGSYRLNATLIPRDGLAPEVAQSITFMGRRQADGSVLVTQSGRF